MLENTSEFSFDEQIVPGARLDELSPTLWNRFRTVISPPDDDAELKLTIYAAPPPPEHG